MRCSNLLAIRLVIIFICTSICTLCCRTITAITTTRTGCTTTIVNIKNHLTIASNRTNAWRISHLLLTLCCVICSCSSSICGCCSAVRWRRLLICVIWRGAHERWRSRRRCYILLTAWDVKIGFDQLRLVVQMLPNKVQKI